MAENVVVHTLHCMRCHYNWLPRGAELPMQCAKCNSPWWNTPYDEARLKGNLSSQEKIMACKKCQIDYPWLPEHWERKMQELRNPKPRQHGDTYHSKNWRDHIKGGQSVVPDVPDEYEVIER